LYIYGLERDEDVSVLLAFLLVIKI